MASFFDAVEAGSRIANAGISAYDRERAYTDRLAARDYDRQVASTAVKTEVSRYADTQAERLKKDKIEAERAASLEKHLRFQDDLTRAETESIKAGRGKNGLGRTGAPQDLVQANKNLENARKAVSAYTVGGHMPPDELQATYHAALADVDRLSQGLGLRPATTAKAPSPVAHPAEHWWNNILGGSAPAVNGDDYSQFETK